MKMSNIATGSAASLDKPATRLICFQFIDADGKFVDSPLMERLIGIDLGTLKSNPRVVGIAGGKAKIPSILASLKGKMGQCPDHRSTDGGAPQRGYPLDFVSRAESDREALAEPIWAVFRSSERPIKPLCAPLGLSLRL
jgi:Putative sugar-binding domain